jgi:hypothetical protein
MFGIPITPKIYAILVVLLIIAALGAGTYYYHGKYESEITAYDILKSQNVQLVDQIKADSDAVAKLAADGAAREAVAKAALQAANDKVRYYSKKADDILAAQAQTPTNLCTSADQIFNTFIAGAK